MATKNTKIENVEDTAVKEEKARLKKEETQKKREEYKERDSKREENERNAKEGIYCFFYNHSRAKGC